MEGQQNCEALHTVAEIELVYRAKVRYKDRLVANSADKAYEILKSCWDTNKIELVEQAKLLLLDNANTVLGMVDLSQGGVTGTVVDPRIIFAAALKANAASLILAHNHPSGNLVPSYADKEVTRKIDAGGKLLDIRLLDHIILTDDGYYSMKNEGDF